MDKRTKGKIQAMLQQMSIEEQVGQLFILAFPGKNSEILREIITAYGIAGCYISQDNAETFSEAAQLSQSIANMMSKKQGYDLPLILGIDQEGAWGNLIPQATIGPGNLALGLSEDTSDTATMYGIFAQEMGAVGYHAILAPCADINLNPHNPIIGTRSFGEKARLVAKHVSAAVTAIQQEGGLSTAKHFPGHGDTSVDTHRNIPQVDKSLAHLLEQELFPFQAAIDAGVDMVMTTHILFPQLDSQFPATLSKKILTDLLRHRMNFKGLIITDSMNMGAIRKNYDPDNASLQAFLAGADLIMLSEEHYDHDDNYLERQILSIESIVKAVKDRKISQDLLQEKLYRILQKRLQIKEAQEKMNDEKSIHHKDRWLAQNREKEKQIAYSAVHILRDTNHLLPLKKDHSIALVNSTPVSSYKNLMNVRGIGPNQKIPAFKTFAESFLHYQAGVTIFSHEDVQRNYNQLEKYETMIAVTEDYPLPGEDFEKEKQQELIATMIERYKEKLIVVGLRSPYELEKYTDLSTYLCSYSSRSCSAHAAAKKLALG